MKFTKAFSTVLTNVDGEELTRQLKPTQAEIDQAIKENRQLYVQEVPLTVKDALLHTLRIDLTERTPQGSLQAPDPHAEKKMELYELLVKIKGFDEEGELDAEEISLLKERAKKIYGVEAYGFLCRFLENKLD